MEYRNEHQHIKNNLFTFFFRVKKIYLEHYWKQKGELSLKLKFMQANSSYLIQYCSM